MAQEDEFGPACPIPLVYQPHERVEQLKELLDYPENQRQRINIMALIRMYESGELGPLTTGPRMWLCDGKIMDKSLIKENGIPKIPKGSVVWAEGIEMQMKEGHL
ncbi:hypothetical protein Asppvi_004758 [Aspergillus pseudoviridinutans]|uniref:Uncharacterized protein n=1 Tax=Aspergillus pseudoviridinutans TaxID=1517512 RepID=A0A9P3B9L7_9EURO|nr:uncharacterized protein Asppvi_004758 [Aspergillus pseudoviridinutans]GIJ85894.1 hypothetical protein Asppvi_004758 [Aspergillus pseudoviridinutans]